MAAARRVRFVPLRGFKTSYRAYKNAAPTVKERLRIFNELKRRIPPALLPPEFRDHSLGGPLAGFKECHLADDVLLVYTHENDKVSLYRVCSHDELYNPAFTKDMRKKRSEEIERAKLEKKEKQKQARHSGRSPKGR